MDFERAGRGFLETKDGHSFPAKYFVRIYEEKPSRLYDTYGRVEPVDQDVLRVILRSDPSGECTLVLDSGERMHIRLSSMSGSISVLGLPATLSS